MSEIFKLNTVVLDEEIIRLAHAAHQLEIALRNLQLHSSQTLSPYEAFLFDLKKYIRNTQTFLDLSAQTESHLHLVAENASSFALWSLGKAMPALLITHGPAIIGGVAALVLVAAIRKQDPGGLVDRLCDSVDSKLPQLVSTTATVAVTAHLVDGADDFVAGLVGLPKPPHDGLYSGEDALAQAAIGIAGILGTGALQETNVTVTRVTKDVAPPADNYESLINRIPRAQEDGEQIRIEHYKNTGTYVVYLGGTIDPSLTPGNEPWDMTSNINAIAGSEAGSYQAAELAMKEAGIEATDNVIVVGHSQGGLIAAQLAASGNYRITDVVTVGAPVHHVETPRSTNTVVVEHAEDVIPALSGVATPATAGRIVVNTSLYEGKPAPQNEVLPAHSLSRYQETAKLMDSSKDPELTAEKAKIRRALSGECDVTTWRAERVKKDVFPDQP